MCSICGKTNSKSLCNKCNIKLKKEFSFKTENYEKDFKKNFVNHYYLFKYENLIRSQILDLKFHEKPYIYKTIASFCKKNEKSFEKLKKYDIIIIVPISKKRKKDRGYNQSELFAKGMSKMIGAKIEKRVLYKIKDTVPQSSLNKFQREQNAKGIYKVKECKKLKNKKILLVDDVYTTGSTINECANALVQSGINRNQISALTIAKD